MNQISKILFNPGNYERKLDLLFLFLRLSIGALMLTHGVGKFSALVGSEPIQFPDPMGVGSTSSLALAVFTEVFCSLFLILGFGTRFASFLLLVTMLVAAFVIHANDPFGKQEFPLLYALIYVTLAITGAGRFSLDHLITSACNRKNEKFKN